MRLPIAWCAVPVTAAVVAFAVIAAPLPPPDAANPAGPRDNVRLPADVVAYSQTLLELVGEIERKYMRPVTKGELVEVALAGLYEAVRQPIPTGFRDEIHRASEEQLWLLIQRTRASLGDHDAIRHGRDLVVSLQALPRALDPFCGLVAPSEFRRSDADDTPASGIEFAGAPPPPVIRRLPLDFGAGDLQPPITRSAPAGPARVQNVLPGSPAQHAGIRPGDLIVRLDGRPPESAGFADALVRLHPARPGVAIDYQAAQAPIAVTVMRPGQTATIETTIRPQRFLAESVFGVRRRLDGSWDYRLDSTEGIGYIRIGAIGRETHLEFFSAMRALQAPPINGLILDLRWCPGGFLQQAASIARAMLPDSAAIASQLNKVGDRPPVPHFIVPARYLEIPIVVLVNGDTSGGGELIAAALQDAGRAVIAGQRTIGKATVQQPIGDSVGVTFKLSTDLLIRPSGRNMARHPDSTPADDWGVRPDPGCEIAGTTELSRQLKAWWILATLRPPGSTEALPLDDPENDPQRQAALQMVRNLIKKSS